VRLSILLSAFPALTLFFITGCSRTPAKNPAINVQAPPIEVKFADVTKDASITFRHNNGTSGLRLMPETMGSGVAFLDYDNDGYQDLFFVNSRDWTLDEYKAGRRTFPKDMAAFIGETPPRRQPVTNALYHNNGDGTFSDVTSASGMGITAFGMGVAVGDYDNDGRVDLYVTAYPRNYLFHNDGNGHFSEVAAQLGVKGDGWGTCCAWLDYDKDGWLDLFAGRYVRWTPETDVYQNSKGVKIYSNPIAYDGQSSYLYRGQGNGRFQDVSATAGIKTRRKSDGESEPLNGKALGITVCDYNNDGWPDFIVANDTSRNYLFENKRDGTFEEVAQQAGIAQDRFGHSRAGMGIDTADIDHSNHDSVVIGNFSQEMLGLYYNTGQNSFVDVAPDSEIGRISHMFLTFGCLFFDYDNDGWADILAGNGHVQPQVEKVQPGDSYAQRSLLFHNQSDGRMRFREVGLNSGAALRQRIVARGLAYADFDLDGDLDVALSTNGGPAHLWRNDGGDKNNALRLTLRGAKSNRNGIGSLVKIKVGNDALRVWVRSGSSYLSQSELPVTLGLGQNAVAEGVAIFWPSGAKTTLENIRSNQMIVVDEAKGLVQAKPFPGKK
jgi:hypothetical protein